VPADKGQSFLRRRNGAQDIRQTLEASRREREGHIDRIQNPPQHLFAGGPRGVAFGELRERNRLGAMDWIEGGQRAKNGVNGMHESTPRAGCRRGLGDGEEIVDEDVNGSHRTLEMV
jgi:hypothetical protein